MYLEQDLAYIVYALYIYIYIYIYFSGFPDASGVKKKKKIHLPWVQSLVQVDPTCHGATKSIHHNTEPMLQNPGAATIEPT